MQLEEEQLDLFYEYFDSGKPSSLCVLQIMAFGEQNPIKSKANEYR